MFFTHCSAASRGCGGRLARLAVRAQYAQWSEAPDACALKLWQVAFDNLGRHVKCGGVLFITDLLGDVFTGDGPRCWPEFGRRWMVENGFEHVRRQTGDPCGNHYPFLFLRRKC